MIKICLIPGFFLAFWVIMFLVILKKSPEDHQRYQSEFERVQQKFQEKIDNGEKVPSSWHLSGFRDASPLEREQYKYLKLQNQLMEQQLKDGNANP